MNLLRVASILTVATLGVLIILFPKNAPYAFLAIAGIVVFYRILSSASGRKSDD
jgi:hypothetical protein